MKTAQAYAEPSPVFSLQRQSQIGLLALFFLLIVFGGWASVTHIPGAVIAPAQFEVSGNRNAIQHSEGGVLDHVLVREGDVVTAQQPIAILAAPRVQGELAAIRARLNETQARRARLEAERDGGSVLAISAELERSADLDPTVENLVADQQRLLDARREVTASQASQLRRRLQQISDQIEGIDSQAFAKREELAILTEELDRSRDLYAKGLIEQGRVDALRRDSSQLMGILGELAANRAQAKERAVEIELEIFRLGAVEREAAAEQLAALIPLEIETAQALIAAQSRVDHLTLRAPAAGTILGLRHSGSGSVLQPAEVLAWLVPSEQPLVLAARIETARAAELHPGQTVRIRLPKNGLSQDDALVGRVQAISADSLRDPETGAGFFRAEVTLDPLDLERLRKAGLMPGMTAEAYFITVDRSPLVWLLEPFTRYLSGAMRES